MFNGHETRLREQAVSLPTSSKKKTRSVRVFLPAHRQRTATESTDEDLDSDSASQDGTPRASDTSLFL